RTIEDVERDSDRDYWMSSEEAKSYGLIDNVLVKAALPKKEE
ncbi:MAG: ATP-dependent Clp protease proteolytic subunit, partial [Rhodothermales bacterium]|nr:ATP-dependent Clp protease proteolytic subunit [Rhodothermales bacterium]